MTGLTLSEAARFLGLSIPQTRRRVKAGAYRSHRDERGRIIVEINHAAALEPAAAPDPTMRELVQLRVEVGMLRQDREALLAAIAHYWTHTAELVAQNRALLEAGRLKDMVIAELALGRPLPTPPPLPPPPEPSEGDILRRIGSPLKED